MIQDTKFEGLKREILFPTPIYMKELQGTQELNKQLFKDIKAWMKKDPAGLEKTNVNGRAELTFKLKLPSLSEMVPITFPFTRMFTPIRASLPSSTDPEILAC